MVRGARLSGQVREAIETGLQDAGATLQGLKEMEFKAGSVVVWVLGSEATVTSIRKAVESRAAAVVHRGVTYKLCSEFTAEAACQNPEAPTTTPAATDGTTAAQTPVAPDSEGAEGSQGTNPPKGSTGKSGSGAIIGVVVGCVLLVIIVIVIVVVVLNRRKNSYSANRTPTLDVGYGTIGQLAPMPKPSTPSPSHPCEPSR